VLSVAILLRSRRRWPIVPAGRRLVTSAPARPADLPQAPRGHNRGPPLEDYSRPEWEDGDPFIYLCWKAAHRRAWRSVSREVALRRLGRAEALGLTYEEYTLEILERGRYLQAEDVEAIARIKVARRKKAPKRKRPQSSGRSTMPSPSRRA
jgi:hypothetical protein